MTAETMTRTDVHTQLETARRSAASQRSELTQVETELAQAAEALDYGRANTLKQRADELRPTVLLAENSITALEATVKALADHDAQARKVQIDQERQARAEAARAAGMAEERDAIAECGRLVAQAREHVTAAGEALRAGLAAQDRAGQARLAVYAAEVEGGWQEPGAFISTPNHVSAVVEADPVLTAVFRSTS